MKVNSHTSMRSSRPHLPLVPPSYGYIYTEHAAPATGIPEIGATQMGVPGNVVPPSATVMVRPTAAFAPDSTHAVQSLWLRAGAGRPRRRASCRHR